MKSLREICKRSRLSKIEKCTVEMKDRALFGAQAKRRRRKGKNFASEDIPLTFNDGYPTRSYVKGFHLIPAHSLDFVPLNRHEALSAEQNVPERYRLKPDTNEKHN